MVKSQPQRAGCPREARRVPAAGKPGAKQNWVQVLTPVRGSNSWLTSQGGGAGDEQGACIGS